MLIPTGDYIFIEKIQTTSLVLPDNIQQGKGDFFLVNAVGPGYHTDKGVRITPEVRTGDVVAIVGAMMKLRYNDKDYLIAKAAHVIAVDRFPKKEDIPNAV